MTTSAQPVRPLETRVRPAVAALFVLALILFIIDAAAGGGMITMTNSGWLLPGGLAAVTLAWLIDRVT